MERHECYETFYELYEYVCISLEAIVDRESHPHVYSSLSFTWDRETKTKAQGLLTNLKTFGFISTFFITKNSLGTLKPIVGGGGCGGEVICLKRVQIVLSVPKFGPPPLQSKIPGSAPAL